MARLFCHADTFARIEAGLKPFTDQLRPVTMDDDGRLAAPWGGTPPSDPAADIVYATTDAYFSPAVSDFLRAVLKSDGPDWFQSSAAGIENPVLQSIGGKARLYTSSHEQSAAIAEWVLWAGLDHFQGGPERRQAQAARDWRRLDFREIASTHWLVYGFGNIGRETARRLRALGAEVTGLRRTLGPDPDADRMVGPERLEPMLGEVDAVLLACPLTEATEGLANAPFFAAMKPGALFVNVARGACVCEPALVAGLDGGRPGHAALDVVAEEPLSGESVLWDHPRVTLTPHISANTDSARARTDRLFLENLGRYLEAGRLRNLVPGAAFETG